MDMALNSDQLMIQQLGQKVAQTELSAGADKLEQVGGLEIFLAKL